MLIDMIKMLDDHVQEANILLAQKNNNYEGNVADAWFGSDDTKISVSDKVLKVSSTGADPSLETAYTPNVSDHTFYFTFEMKSNSEGEGEISWKLGAEEDYSNENKTDFSPIDDSQWHEYKVKMPLNGRLNTLRIEPSEKAGDIEIRNMAMRTEDDYLLRKWELY